MDARRYLGELMVSLVASFNASGEPDLDAIRERLQGAARALVATGDLPASQVHEVLAEFDDLLEDRGMLERVSFQFESVAETVAATRVADVPEPPQPPQPRGPGRLQAVVAVNETVAEFDGYTVTAISLELWSAHLSFRYAVQGGDMRRLVGASPGVAEISWEAHDDLGGVYRQIGGSAGGGGTGGLTGQVNFAGPLADGARQLAVRLRYGDQGPASVLIDVPDQEK